MMYRSKKGGSMKKYLAVVAAIILSLAGNCYAASSEAINPEAEPVTIYGKSLSSSGINKIVAGSTVKSQTGGGQFYTGGCRVLGISIKGVTAGDNIGVYDTSVATKSGSDISGYDIRDLEFELGISANNSSTFIDAKSATFYRGIDILAVASTIVTSITFDY